MIGYLEGEINGTFFLTLMSTIGNRYASRGSNYVKTVLVLEERICPQGSRFAAASKFSSELAPAQEGFCVQESKMGVTEVVSIENDGKSYHMCPFPFSG